MKITRVNESVPYDAPGHYNMLSSRLHNPGDVENGKAMLGISWYLPGGSGAKNLRVPAEMVYYIVEGEMTLTTPDGEYVLGPGDSVHLPAGYERTTENKSSRPAAMLIFSIPG